MHKKILPILLLCFVFFFTIISPVKAGDDDYSERLMKALNVSPKAGADGLQQNRELAQLIATISSMKVISTGLGMYNTDHSGKYPSSLKELISSKTMTYIPTGYSKAGHFPFVYISKNGGKEYTLHCKGSNFAQFGIPANYPRYSEKSNSRKLPTIYLKPGVANPPLHKPTAASEVQDQFKEAVYQLPDLLQKRDPKQAKKVRLQLTKAIKSGKLTQDEVETAQKVIKTCNEIEQGRKK